MFNLRKTAPALVLGAGILIMSLMAARTFGLASQLVGQVGNLRTDCQSVHPAKPDAS